MRQPTAPEQSSRRLRIALIGGGLVLALLVGIGVYGLLRGPAAQPAPDTHSTSTKAPEPGRDLTPRPKPESTEAERFSRSVAEGLFAWDTGLGYGAHEYMQALSLIHISEPTRPY